MAERMLHCWADGPRYCLEHDEPEPVAGPHYYCDTVGQTCFLEAGHAPPCEWTRGSEITVTFPHPAGEGER